MKSEGKEIEDNGQTDEISGTELPPVTVAGGNWVLLLFILQTSYFILDP
jgi:hypothetical protein